MPHRILLLSAIASLLICGCFHKDVATDRADDVQATLLYQGPGGPLILTKEAIFQANSKSSGGGVTHISGYSEFRLSAYDPQTGALRARVPLGEMIKEANALLGVSLGKVWMFSIDPALGLHWRDPKTLAVGADWPTLQKQPGLQGFRPAKPDWPLIDQYFAYDFSTERLVLTDEAGFRYLLDPATFALQKTDQRMPQVEWEAHMLSNTGLNADGAYFSLSGETRKTIEGPDTASNPDVNFLFGEFFLATSLQQIGHQMAQARQSFARHRQTLQDSVDKLLAAFPKAGAETDQLTSDKAEREAWWAFQSLQREIKDVDYEERHLETFRTSASSAFLLSEDGTSAYIFHTDLIADTARAHISQVRLQPDKTWRTIWQTRLPSVYHNASKADQAGAFEEVFSSGNPSFDYFWADILDGKLILIAQLRMLALELKTGRLLWDVAL